MMQPQHINTKGTGFRSMAEKRNGLKDFSLVGQVAKDLRRDILNGAIKGGEKLLENELKERFGISRTPLREAFRVLEKEGLIELVPRRGAFVRRITIQDIRENFPIRAMLEGFAAKLSCDHITSRDIHEMEKSYRLMEESARKKDFEAFAEHHFHSHEIFINASKNATLIHLLKGLRMHALWRRYTYHYYKEVYQKSLGYHRQLLDLFQSKKPPAGKIEKLVYKHILVATESFVAAMNKLEANQ
jgi:DNA-binding GntR family transcriptional regulator